MPRICIYCKKEPMNGEMYVVRQAVKPKGEDFRWKDTGLCCEHCHEVDGKQVTFELGEEL